MTLIVIIPAVLIIIIMILLVIIITMIAYHCPHLSIAFCDFLIEQYLGACLPHSQFARHENAQAPKT